MPVQFVCAPAGAEEGMRYGSSVGRYKRWTGTGLFFQKGSRASARGFILQQGTALIGLGYVLGRLAEAGCAKRGGRTQFSPTCVSAGLRLRAVWQHTALGGFEWGRAGERAERGPAEFVPGAGFKRARGGKKRGALAAAELGSCFKQSASAASGAASG